MNPCIYCARLVRVGEVCPLNHVDKRECSYYAKTKTIARENPLPEEVLHAAE
jgi:hypothetical protein